MFAIGREKSSPEIDTEEQEPVTFVRASTNDKGSIM